MVYIILVNVFSLLIKRIVSNNPRFALTYFLTRSTPGGQLHLNGNHLEKFLAISVEIKVIILIKY